MPPTIIVPFDDRHASAIRRIRRAVFTKEQQVPEAIDFDGRDPDAVHALAGGPGTYVGTGRMLADGHIGRIAVLKPCRKEGVGRSIIRALVVDAARRGMGRVFLGAQLHAVPFYEKLGFTSYGDVFNDAGIAHIHMEKQLSSFD